MRRILFFVCFFALFFSCNSDDDTNSQTQSESNFYALKIGNSWVYKNYSVNPTNEELEFSGVIDSVSIVGTEVISGKTFYKFRTKTTGNDTNNPNYNFNGEIFELIREEEGALVNDIGVIHFVNNDFNERIISEQSWGTTYRLLMEEPVDVTVEAGTFTCFDMNIYARTPEGEQLNGLDHYYYADGIGKIGNSFSLVSSGQILAIIRLDSYNIQ